MTIMKEQERYEKMESWLAGKLTGDDKKKFETELRKDENFAFEAEVIRDLTGIGKDSNRKQLRETLAAIRSESSPKSVSIFCNPMAWAVAASFLVLISAYFMFSQKNCIDILRS